MEDAEEAGGITAEVGWVLGQCFDRVCRGLEQGSISEALIAADERPELVWDGKGEHEMMSGQLPLHLSFQPLSGFVVLAAGTVAVAARAGHAVKLTALLTWVNDGTVGFGSALADGVDNLFVLDGHGLPVAIEILGAVDTEDVIDEAPVISPP